MDDPPNKRKGGRGNGAVPSPLRKKKPPALSPTRSSHYSTLAASALTFAAAVDRSVAAMDSDKPLPTSIVEHVYEVAPPPVKKKSPSSRPSSRSIVKIGHIPKTEFVRVVREDRHYKAKTKYLEPQIKKDLLSKQFWLLHHFNTP